VNPALTLWLDDAVSRCCRLISQASAWARAYVSESIDWARATLTRAANAMETIQQKLYERVYERRMAVRRMFLVDPTDIESGYTREGRLVLAHLARHCSVLASVHTSDPIELARVNGMQTAFALILSDLYDDLPDFARLMAQEEARQREEIIA
jgi:hypothetical protein